MELKYNTSVSPYLGSFSLNRTFMELKYVSLNDTFGYQRVLIEPLWN